MRQPLVRLSAAAVVAAVTLSACSSSGNQDATSPSASATGSSPSAQAHNSADATFAQNMIPCHKQAVQMSDIILIKQGIDPRVIQLANQISGAEGPDIQRMESWLSQWRQPATPMSPGPTAGMPAMQGMAGMMSPAQMTALQNAQGADASKQFLAMMVQNHQHAIMLAQNEIRSGQYSPAVAMAHSIATSEQQEVNTMQGILG